MPDVVVVGGGIVGTACALELTAKGAAVTLLEREALAAGASGRNQGWFVLLPDPACTPMSRVSLERYLELIDGSAVPVAFDREPVGHLQVTRDHLDPADLEARAARWAAIGVGVEILDEAGLRTEEPAIADGIGTGLLIDHGQRVDPAALTIAHALRAGELGADVRRHTAARALTTVGDRVTGVVTDDGVLAADAVVVAAGPWSSRLVRPVGIDLPVTGSRGWIVELDAPSELLRHLLEEDEARLGHEYLPTADGFAADGLPPADVTALLHTAIDGAVVCGASHHPALRPEPDDTDAPRRIVERAIGVVPALAGTTVRSVRWGIRPLSPDGRPIVGRLGEGLFAAAGHGPEGVILGGGTGALVAALVTGHEPPFDPAPFDPSRFASVAR